MSDQRWRLPDWECTQEFSANEIGQAWPWGLKFAGIDKLHAETKGAGVKVAVLDTGVESSHPDLAPNILETRDFSRSVAGRVTAGDSAEDIFGHGTHCAGTIAAIDNGVGVIGLAPEAKLLIGKVLSDNGSGSMDAVANGIMWAVDAGADVISMSLGGPSPDDSVKHALAYASQHGVLVACAAGNSGRKYDRATGKEVNTVDYPGKWTNLCSCVGAHDDRGQIASFSSRGPEVDVLAPGVRVLSCYLRGQYATMDGTSMATPFVAGTIALIIAYRKAKGLPKMASQAELEAELFKTAIKIGNGGPPFGSGHGLLNPKGLFDDLLAKQPEVKPAPKPQPAPAKTVRLPWPQLQDILPAYSWELVGTLKVAAKENAPTVADDGDGGSVEQISNV